MKKSMLCINTGGVGDLHGLRMRRLTQKVEADLTFFDVDKSESRLENSRTIWDLLTSKHWDLVYQEATGVAGGVSMIGAALGWGQPYVVSTGDPVGGYFRTVKGPLWGAAFEVYERLLYRHCAGFIGWTPYLTGMAMKMGARRAVTIEGAVELDRFKPYAPEKRLLLKEKYGLDPSHLVCGVVGSLKWTPRQKYCYGLELVEMLNYLHRRDVSVLIVGDGNGRSRLEERVPASWRSQVTFTGRVEEDEVADALNAMDVGFITQTLDGLGSYRLTTKLPEYLAAGLPVAMSPIPGFYDYAQPAGWALPAHHPASADFHRGCARWLDELECEDVEARAARARRVAEKHFDYESLAARFANFIHALLE